jgi:hypothetical protein
MAMPLARTPAVTIHYFSKTLADDRYRTVGIDKGLNTAGQGLQRRGGKSRRFLRKSPRSLVGFWKTLRDIKQKPSESLQWL